ncbi:CrcB family protein [Virgibacillus sp. Bac330]|uniref:fluoride efflux transporter FluC n=1 Tax=Virgibacillus sp. Bac330 TaxID=2419841 RepID=UPI000EF4BEFC|nr:CrcB family protein [Virgibacillus sp. Bac330]
MSFFYVALGGFCGSFVRYQLSIIANKRLIGTWLANVTGSILLASLVFIYTKEILPHTWWLILGVGFCGAYTTFSTFGNETMQLLLQQQWNKAIGYISLSFIVSILPATLILSL